MVSTVGKKLQLAREQKRLSIEEAARVTKIRPDRIADLEGDDFTQFPNLTYAKGFLLIYAKYLGVDVAEFASSFENTSQINISNYEYLNNALPPSDDSSRRRSPGPVMQSSKPLLAVMLLLAVCVAAGVIYIFVNSTAKRLSPAQKEGTAATPISAPTPIAVIPSRIVESDQNALRSATPAPTPKRTAEKPPATPLPAQPGATPRFVGEPEVRRPLIVNPDSSNPKSAPTPAPSKPRELIIQPTRKTWVQIQRDDEHSAPVFEDWIYPDARPLKMHGAKFWIQVRDPDAVKITNDGQPVPVGGNKIVID
jgi:cytoskeletal protein RodZ